jgi:hypothetical protein
MANNFPTIRPSLNMNFAGTGVLPPDVTFTRASQSGGYYDGKTVVKAEENLELQSQVLNTAPWTGANVTVVENTGDTTAPNGSSTANKWTAVAGLANHFRTQAITTVNGATYTTTRYLKKGTHNFIQIYISNDGAKYANYDLDTGVIGTSSGVVSSSIVDEGSGWYRCVVVWVSTGTNRYATTKLAQTASDINAFSWTAAGTETVYAWGCQTEQRDFATAYTPTTTQPITNYIPKLLFAPANVPVFDHNPTTGEALGLSVWEARTNLLQRSQEFDNAYWNNDSCTVLSNQIIAPDGTLTADKYIPNIGLLPSTASTGIRRPTFAVSSGATYTFSEFAKKGEFDTWATRDNYASGNLLVINLTTGAIVSNPAFYTNVRVIDCGNGWWRIVYTFVATTTNYVTEAARTNSTGDGTSGIYIWGAQLEAGAFATPYIPTVASTVTRSADVAVMTGVNFSRWFNNAQGALVVEGRRDGTNNVFPNIVAASDGTGNNRILLSIYRYESTRV